MAQAGLERKQSGFQESNLEKKEQKKRPGEG
jgi:hypothetical protein